MSTGRVHDLAVVGGGPVGLAAAIEARAAGLDVVVLEPRGGPVDKACGEGLMPGALAALGRLGVPPEAVPGQPLTGITYTSGDGARTARHDFAGEPGRGVRRTVLSAALSTRAAQAGVPVVPARVRGLTQDAASVRLALDGPVVDGPADGAAPAWVDARWVVAADGLHSTVRRLLGVGATSDGRRYAVRQHAAVAPWSTQVEVYWGRRIEAYVTPVGPDEVGVAVLGPRAGDLRVTSALRELPALHRRLRGAAWSSAARGAGPLRQRVASRVAGRVLLAGDAAGYVDALTGEGLMVGMATARAAVAAVVEASGCARPQEALRAVRRYERDWWRVTRSYRWLTTALVTATRPAGAHTGVVGLAASAPWLFGAAVEQVGGTGRALPSSPPREDRAGSLALADRPEEHLGAGGPA